MRLLLALLLLGTLETCAADGASACATFASCRTDKCLSALLPVIDEECALNQWV